jgi:hypothetical protein
MPRGPHGERRPADVIGNAVHVMQIATGEIEDRRGNKDRKAPRQFIRKSAKPRKPK